MAHEKHRYEDMLPQASVLKQAQLERIQQDTEIEEIERAQRELVDVQYTAHWKETQHEKGMIKKLLEEPRLIKEELKLARRASITVRREALRQLLQNDLDIYEKELKDMNKAFYLDRSF